MAVVIRTYDYKGRQCARRLVSVIEKKALIMFTNLAKVWVPLEEVAMAKTEVSVGDIVIYLGYNEKHQGSLLQIVDLKVKPECVTLSLATDQEIIDVPSDLVIVPSDTPVSYTDQEVDQSVEPTEDIVAEPNHYTTGTIQPRQFMIDVCRHHPAFTAEDGYFFGQVGKYLPRAGAKIYEGKTAEESMLIDLKKAKDYLDTWIKEKEEQMYG